MNHLLVVPTYNEIENIEKLVKTVFELYPQISILIVDDSSPDKTADKVKKLQNEYKNLFLLERKSKTGLASAYIDGFNWGLDKGFDLFTTCDADFSHNPKYIQTAIDKINEGYDLAVGSRLIKGGDTNEKNYFRNILTRGGNIWANLILGTNISDLLEGFNTYTKSALLKIDLNKVSAKGFIFQAEMKYRAIKAGCKIFEFPIFFEIRREGKSKMNSFIIFEALFQVIKLRFSK